MHMRLPLRAYELRQEEPESKIVRLTKSSGKQRTDKEYVCLYQNLNYNPAVQMHMLCYILNIL